MGRADGVPVADPAVGATLVWLVAIYFLATGAIWQSIGLILYGVLVVASWTQSAASLPGRQGSGCRTTSC